MPTTFANPPTVVELFQSQGCSSCPPANAAVNAIADRLDVLALSFGVTYWDQLGWKHTFASPRITPRQSDYAHHAGRAQVATPQVIVNGGPAIVGSNRQQFAAAGRPGARVPPRSRRGDPPRHDLDEMGVYRVGRGDRADRGSATGPDAPGRDDARVAGPQLGRVRGFDRHTVGADLRRSAGRVSPVRADPTRLTGAVAGLAAGGVAATLYGFACPETSAMFVVTFYKLGLAMAALVGLVVGPRFLRW